MKVEKSLDAIREIVANKTFLKSIKKLNLSNNNLVTVMLSRDYEQNTSISNTYLLKLKQTITFGVIIMIGSSFSQPFCSAKRNKK